MLQEEPCAQNAVCIGSNNTNLNIYASLNDTNPHLQEKCFVICLVLYENDIPMELYFNDKNRWVVNNINKAKKFTYCEAIKELYFLDIMAGYGIKGFYKGELQLIDLYIYYSDEEDI